MQFYELFRMSHFERCSYWMESRFTILRSFFTQQKWQNFPQQKVVFQFWVRGENKKKVFPIYELSWLSNEKSCFKSESEFRKLSRNDKLWLGLELLIVIYFFWLKDRQTMRYVDQWCSTFFSLACIMHKYTNSFCGTRNPLKKFLTHT